jgi:hypothetical protein
MKMVRSPKTVVCRGGRWSESKKKKSKTGGMGRNKANRQKGERKGENKKGGEKEWLISKSGLDASKSRQKGQEKNEKTKG